MSPQAPAAVLVVRAAPDGMLELTDEGKALLSEPQFNKCPLLVVLVAGPARLGLMTELLQLLCNKTIDAGFDHLHNATEGVWMWSKPVRLGSKPHQLVLLHVEENQGTEQASDSVGVFHLIPYLVSSVVIWTESDEVNQAFFDTMAHLARHATSIIGLHNVEEQEGDGSTSDIDRTIVIAQHGPDLLLVPQGDKKDFITKYKTSSKYLMRLLSPLRIPEERRTGIEAAKDLFLKHTCLHADKREAKPACDSDSLYDQQSGMNMGLDLQELKHVLDNARVRTMDDNPLTGMRVAAFFEAVIDAINTNERRDLRSLYEEAACSVLVQETIRNFSEEAQSIAQHTLTIRSLGPNQQKKELQKKKDELLRQFSKAAQGDASMKEKQKRHLEAVLAKQIDDAYSSAVSLQHLLLKQEQAKNAEEDKAKLKLAWKSYATRCPFQGYRFETEESTITRFNKVVARQLRAKHQDVLQTPEHRIHNTLSCGLNSVELTKYAHIVEEVILEQLEECKRKQANANDQTVRSMAVNACAIKGSKSGNPLYIDFSGELCAKPGNDVEQKVQHIFVDTAGIPFCRRIENGDIVGVYSIHSHKLWKVRVITGGMCAGQEYRICATELAEFKLCKPVPEDCQFEVVADGDSFCLKRPHAGFVKEKRSKPAFKLSIRNKTSFQDIRETVKDDICTSLKAALTEQNAIVE